MRACMLKRSAGAGGAPAPAPPMTVENMKFQTGVNSMSVTKLDEKGS